VGTSTLPTEYSTEVDGKRERREAENKAVGAQMAASTPKRGDP